MLAGIQEILTIGLIIVCLFFIPRFFRDPDSDSKNLNKKINLSAASSLSGKTRLGIVISILFPLITSVIIKPWEGSVVLFICVGIMPVIVGWAIVWVTNGYKNNIKNK